MSEVMLLVGGPADGRRVKTDGRPKVYYLPKSNRLDLHLSVRDDYEASMFKEVGIEEYVLCESNVYMHSSISHMDVVAVLTSGYRCEIGN